MRIPQEAFENIMKALQGVDGAVYDKDARLFCGGDGTEYPAFGENHRAVGGADFSSYILYATVGGKTLPLEHGMNHSLMDESRAMEVPDGCAMPCAYVSGLASHFDKPLEVLAIETEAKPGIRPKWDVWMVRDIGDKEGYINDSVARAISQR
jgi:hypothetical protein